VNIYNPFSWIQDLLPSNKVVVNSESMLGSAAIWFAMNTISGDVAKMPLDKMVEGKGGSKKKDRSHSAQILLRDQPNEYQTADVFKEQIQAHALGWGNGRAAIIRNGERPVELIPLMPDRTVTVMHEGKKYHFTRPDKDQPITSSDYREAMVEMLNDGNPEKWIGLEDADVLHIQGFGYDGFCGKSIASVGKDSIGVDLRSQKYQDKQLEKGFNGKLMLHEGRPNTFKNEDEARRFLEQFRERHKLDGDAETVGMLREGMTATVLAMSNVDAQFIEQRKFSRQDVMLWFGLQHIPGDNSSVSYNSLEQKQLAYLASCLDRWLVRWESQCRAKLLTKRERDSGLHYFKFNRATWLRTDINTTADVLSKLIQAKVINRNEARATLDYNPVDGGDEFENPAIQVNDTARAAVVDRLSRLMDVESKRVKSLLEQESPIKKIEAFYQKWQKTLGDAIEALGADRSIAVLHCENAITGIIAGGEPENPVNAAERLADEVLN